MKNIKIDGKVFRVSEEEVLRYALACNLVFLPKKKDGKRIAFDERKQSKASVVHTRGEGPGRRGKNARTK